jgi:sulfite reductase alpha subunit-like flavoprotein
MFFNTIAGIDGCIDQTFTKVFWKTLGDLIGRELQPHTDQRLPSRYQIQWIEETEQDVSTHSMSSNRKIPPDYTAVPLVSNTRVTSDDHWQDVRLLEFNTNLPYKCGDVAVILPQCSFASIQLLAKFLNVEDKLHHRFIATNEISSLSMTVLELFRDYLHITRVPSRSFFEKLVWFSDDERERERLIEFIQPGNMDELYTYCHRPRRTSVEVLQDFPQTTSRIPFDYVFDLFQPIRPRLFSIASSPKVHQNRIQLLVAVVRYKTIIALPREGLCSNYLVRLQPGEHVPMRISSSFNLIDDQQPAIMIGPGTGVAPFRGWILERSLDKEKLNMLFFGCRYRAKDAYVEGDLLKDTINLIYIPAYSRDQEEKIYVQHKIIEYGHLIWEWISDKQARIYLAGSAKQIPDQVSDALRTVFIQHGQMTSEQAGDYLREMERTKQFQRETWS